MTKLSPAQEAFDKTMRVVEIKTAGGPEQLVPGVRFIPRPKAGQVLIRVEAAGINGPDLMQRKGLYPAPAGASDLLGLEVSGVVAALGEGVRNWLVGDALTALTNGGGYAEYVCVDARHALPIPAGFSLRDAAGLPESFFTVWSNLFAGVGLRDGETLLVHGGAGSIGTTAIQLAKAFGITVIATDSPAARCSICTELGADRVVDFREEDFCDVVRAMGGASVILDIVGGANVAKNFKAAAPGGRIVQLAFAAGSTIELNLMPLMLKRLTLTGSTLRTRSADFKAEIAVALLEDVWPKIAQGCIKPVTSHCFPLERAGEAHALMESGGHTGKILLEVNGS